MTSMGLEMPPLQNAFQIWSTWALIGPVITAYSSLQRLGSSTRQRLATLRFPDADRDSIDAPEPGQRRPRSRQHTVRWWIAAPHPARLGQARAANPKSRPD